MDACSPNYELERAWNRTALASLKVTFFFSGETEKSWRPHLE
jgi:hypothetical protein